MMEVIECDKKATVLYFVLKNQSATHVLLRVSKTLIDLCVVQI